jgi:acetyltransferase-like isoleucine patch superfamily enzyme/aryl carrier-like protein
MNDPEQTAKVFCEIEVDVKGSKRKVVAYRTGDLGEIIEGRIEIKGRIDKQVKVRGIRMELGEIEDQILKVKGVLEAAIKVHNDSLVALVRVMGENGHTCDSKKIRDQISNFLPHYMVPSKYLVRTSENWIQNQNGKTDWNALLKEALSSTGKGRPCETEWEKLVAQCWEEAIGVEVNAESDFLGLGVNSLQASRIVSLLRAKGVKVSAEELYRMPNVEEFARAKSTEGPVPVVTGPKVVPDMPPPPLAWKLKTGILSFMLLAYLGVSYPGLYMLLHAAFAWFEISYTPVHFTLGLCVIWPMMLYAKVAAFLVFVRLQPKVQPGDYPLYSNAHLHVWLFTRVFEQSVGQFSGVYSGAGFLAQFAGSAWACYGYRLLGAKIGRGVVLDGDSSYGYISLPHLVTIGDGSVLNKGAKIRTFEFTQGMLRVAPVVIGRGVHVGAMSIVMPGTNLADDTILAPKTLVNRDTPQAAILHGAEARATKELPYPHMPDIFKAESALDVAGPRSGVKVSPSGSNKVDVEKATPLLDTVEEWDPWVAKMQFAAMNGFLVIVGLSTLPATMLGNFFYQNLGTVGAILTLPIDAVIFDLWLLVLVLVIKAVLRPFLQPGRMSINSSEYVRFWVFQLAFTNAMMVTKSLNKSPMCLMWMRAMGIKMGNESVFWVAASNTFLPHLTSVGDNTFLGALAVFGTIVYHKGRLTLAEVKVENNCVIAQATYINPNTTLGLQSVIGANAVCNYTDVGENQVWFGNPAQKLPVPMQPRKPTPLWLLAAHFGYVVVQISSLKTFDMVCFTIFNGVGAVAVSQGWPWYLLVASWISSYAFIGIFASVVCCSLKWLLLGEIVPASWDMYSIRAFNRDFVVSMRSWPEGAFWSLFKGTSFYPYWYRSMGAKIGKNVYLDMIGFEEPDLITIADNVMILDDSGLDTHYVVDGKWTVKNIQVERNTVIELNSVIMPGSSLDAGVKIEPLSCVMPGERLMTGRWRGNPVSSIDM